VQARAYIVEMFHEQAARANAQELGLCAGELEKSVRGFTSWLPAPPVEVGA
jgi:hypothetical protein